MKRNVLKMAMPFMAFFMAIVFAFAFDDPQTSLDFDENYIYQNGVCVKSDKFCNNLGNIPCTDGGLQVWEKKNGTICSFPLMHRAL